MRDKFSILETIRSVLNPSGIAATLSLGFGRDGSNFAENYSFASLSIEMALSRGGDQAVVKDRYNFTFYGGKTKETERRTKVKSRVIANSLSELIAQSSEVFVMGHKKCRPGRGGRRCRRGVHLPEKRASIPTLSSTRRSTSPRRLIAQLQELPEYDGAFLSADDAMLLADPRSLLIVVDTNRPDQVESKPLLESIPRVAVIDHHRRAADYIEQVVLNLHEPFVSSALGAGHRAFAVRGGSAGYPAGGGPGAAGRYCAGHQERFPSAPAAVPLRRQRSCGVPAPTRWTSRSCSRTISLKPSNATRSSRRRGSTGVTSPSPRWTIPPAAPSQPRRPTSC